MKKTLITIVVKNSGSIKERRKMVRSILKTMDEYYGAAEPPVRCGAFPE